MRSVFILAYFAALGIHVIVLLYLLLLGFPLLIPIQPAFLFYWFVLALAAMPLILMFRRMRRPDAMTPVTFFASAPGIGVAITLLTAFSAVCLRSALNYQGGLLKDERLERFLLPLVFAWLAIAVSEICMRHLEKRNA
jgi:hypothetical protein